MEEGIISAVIAAVGLFATWLGWRRRELRRDDVYAWGNKCIEVLQTINLICAIGPMRLSPEDLQKRFLDLTFQTSVLIEQGRLLFKNKITDKYGAHKPEAYRGYRPRILDYLVAAHQISCEWHRSDSKQKQQMRVVSEDCLKHFVSLMQKEVGRSRTASTDTSKRGSGVHLGSLLRSVSQDRLDFNDRSDIGYM